MYKVIYSLGFLVRQFFLPNPFTPIGPMGELYNWCAGGLFFGLSYAQVSMFYRRGSDPAAGSLCFNLMYFVNTGVTYFIMLLYPLQWLMIVATVVYLVGSFALLSYIGNGSF